MELAIWNLFATHLLVTRLRAAQRRISWLLLSVSSVISCWSSASFRPREREKISSASDNLTIP
jgi:hypothetical protein